MNAAKEQANAPVHPVGTEAPTTTPELQVQPGATVCSPLPDGSLLPAEVRRDPTDSEGNRIEPGDELIFQGMALVDKPSGGKTFDHFAYTPVTFCGVTSSGVWILLMKPYGREPYVFNCPAKPRLFRPGRQPSYVTSQEAVQAMREGDMR